MTSLKCIREPLLMSTITYVSVKKLEKYKYYLVEKNNLI